MFVIVSRPSVEAGTFGEACELERAPVNEILARAAIFQGVDPQAVAALADQLQEVSFRRSHKIFVEGELGDRLYIITAGTVKVGCSAPDGRESLLTLMGPSDMFGELAIFDPGPRTSTVTALTQVKAVTMDREALRFWIAERPEIAEQLLRVLARRLRRTNDTLCDLIFTDVPGRVAKQLLRAGAATSAPSRVSRCASITDSRRRRSPSWRARRGRRSTRRCRSSSNAAGSNSAARRSSSTIPPRWPGALAASPDTSRSPHDYEKPRRRRLDRLRGQGPSQQILAPHNPLPTFRRCAVLVRHVFPAPCQCSTT